MSAHTYWRLNVSANNGGSNLQIAELALFVAGGASSAATGGTASASTTSGAQAASLAFDGVASTYWSATVATGQLQYQFASAVDIASYQISSRSDSNQSSMCPKNWTLEYSDNGSSWTVADTVTNQTIWGQQATNSYTVGQNAGSTANGSRLKDANPASQTAISAPAQVMLGKATPQPTTKISGIVEVGGTPTAGLRVRCYLSSSGEKLGETTTDGSGAFSFNCGGFGEVFCVADNKAGGYQAIIYDQLIPG